MHHSRLYGLIIDCQADSLDTGARFWSQALGRDALAPDPDGSYVPLAHREGEPHIEVQRVTHPSRVHIDLESDDVEAEVRRLEALGARRVTQVRHWWVMEAPTGQRFCVLRTKKSSLEGQANRWD